MSVDALRLATYSAAMPLPRGFVPPCLPIKAPQPPSGDIWVHEIKHDGYRLMARRDAARIGLLTQNGHYWSPRYSLIREAVNRLKVRSCLIDGEPWPATRMGSRCSSGFVASAKADTCSSIPSTCWN